MDFFESYTPQAAVHALHCRADQKKRLASPETQGRAKNDWSLKEKEKQWNYS